jgi:hypothetical protein
VEAGVGVAPIEVQVDVATEAEVGDFNILTYINTRHEVLSFDFNKRSLSYRPIPKPI